MIVIMNKNMLKYGFKFLMENKGIQQMFKDMEKLNKEINLTMKNVEKLKKSKGS
jgi:hypothetical protein